MIKAKRKGFKIGFIPITYTFKGSSNVNMITDPIKMLLSLLEWRRDFGLRTLSPVLPPINGARTTAELLQLKATFSQEEADCGDEAKS